MQRTRLNGKRRGLIFIIASVVFAEVLIAADQLTKAYFTKALAGGSISVISDFFYFTYVLNDGAAYGILSGHRTLFLIITPIVIDAFIICYVYAYNKKYKTLIVALMLIICGALGNFIDRAFMASVDYKVTDFICIEIAGYKPFGTFNVADMELTAGVILFVVHLLFLDNNAIFTSKKSSDKNGSAVLGEQGESEDNAKNNDICSSDAPMQCEQKKLNEKKND